MRGSVSVNLHAVYWMRSMPLVLIHTYSSPTGLHMRLDILETYVELSFRMLIRGLVNHSNIHFDPVSEHL